MINKREARLGAGRINLRMGGGGRGDFQTFNERKNLYLDSCGDKMGSKSCAKRNNGATRTRVSEKNLLHVILTMSD